MLWEDSSLFIYLLCQMGSCIHILHISIVAKCGSFCQCHLAANTGTGVWYITALSSSRVQAFGGFCRASSRNSLFHLEIVVGELNIKPLWVTLKKALNCVAITIHHNCQWSWTNKVWVTRPWYIHRTQESFSVPRSLGWRQNAQDGHSSARKKRAWRSGSSPFCI